jgi:chloramphenicol-sensitive protein RarD
MRWMTERARPSVASACSGSGLAAAAGAFAIWGLLPLYLRLLDAVPSLQIVAHRVAWACLFVLVWMALSGELRGLREVLARRGLLLRLAAAALLISANWLAYVWGVSNERVVETSLGYFINPLVNVVLGVAVLSERLNRAQWIAVGLAAAGVVYLTVSAGHLPWIALTLAFSFGLYGLIRKTAQVDALPGLAIETALLAPLAAGYLVWCAIHGSGAMGSQGIVTDSLLVASGAVTAIPLFLFAFGGPAAVHRPQPAAGLRVAGVRRALRPRACRGLRADLERAAGVCRRRIAQGARAAAGAGWRRIASNLSVAASGAGSARVRYAASSGSGSSSRVSNSALSCSSAAGQCSRR